MRDEMGYIFKKDWEVVLNRARLTSQHNVKLHSNFPFPGTSILLRGKSGQYKGSSNFTRVPSLFSAHLSTLTWAR